ncbi:MAG TPA: HAMP domain-containing sensor histidine kinase [Gemmatimonadales bacterium]|nr:HAMP domain-containing sensor histidine kinase [Gemmatimonadales bacterium]
MTFRARLFTGLTLAALLPLGLFAFGIRREMTRRLARDDAGRAAAAARALRDDLDRESDAIAARLAAVRADFERDNRLRLAIVQGESGARRSLLDLAGPAMRAAGLDVLQLQDSSGRIVSSGHFRNEFDRVDTALTAALAAAGPRPILVRARTPDSAVVVLARGDSLRVAGERFTLAGGAGFERRLRADLARDPDLSLAVGYPGIDLPPLGDSLRSVAELDLPFVDLRGAEGTTGSARIRVTQSPATLRALRQGLDRWFLVALAIAAPLALLAAGWLAGRISRPLTALAEQTAAIDLERLDQPFISDRDDEIGALAGVLAAMTERLRLGTVRLREVERRAATGDLARQVNHDVKNGLVPIRNVLRHLSQVARDAPASLPAVFEERRGTLEASLDYLDTLARNYARLSPALEPTLCDVNGVIAEVVRATGPGGATVRAETAPSLPRVPADPLALRRVLENLVSNALDSLAGRNDGVVTLGSEIVGAPEGAAVRLVVADNGPGMTRTELDRAFDDFHTTKPGGTGLGLSIVRRLVLDLGGALRIETAPGSGTRVILELPLDRSVTAGRNPG